MNSPWMRWFAWGVSIAAITVLGYLFFPGHTYLQSDTQIYVPMLERLRDPGLFARDITIVRPHLAYTIYDETAVGLARLSGAGLESVLTAEQLFFRALGVSGLILIALRLGLDAVEAWFVAAVASLGATLAGPAVLTVEYEPVPRGFAIALLILAVGLAAHKWYLAAGVTAAAALLYHAPTVTPFYIAALILAVRRRIGWMLFIPAAAAAAVLMILAHAQPSGAESPALFRRLDPLDESLQRFRAGYSYVSTWRAMWLWEYACEGLAVAVASVRLREAVLLPGLALAGALSVPASWVLLEWQKWALVPQWQPARAVLFITLSAAILSAAAGLRAVKKRRWIEAGIWLTVAFAMPVKHAMLGSKFNVKALGLALAVPAGLALIVLVRRAFRPSAGFPRIALAAAGVLPFFFIPASKLIQNYPRVATPELAELSGWARASTAVDAVFLFPDARTNLDPGIFRARALRALYVDWKSGGQLNYFPELGREWWRRWVETGSGRWSVAASDFPRLAAWGIDYVVLRSAHAIPGQAAEFSNPRYVVYRVTSFHGCRRSGSQKSSLLSLRFATSHSRPLSIADPCD